MQSTSINIKQIANKVLVAILCVASFGAGYYAHQSRQINACKAKDQVVQIANSVVECVDK